jgi:acetoacetyl-CoA reductase
VLRDNLSGAFYMTKPVLEHMIGRGFGRIVNISSIIGETGSIGQANYAASKSGLVGLTKSLALETVRKGIIVNCVAPGFIDTEMVAAVPKEALDRDIRQHCHPPAGPPAEVAHAVRFLLQGRRRLHHQRDLCQPRCGDVTPSCEGRQRRVRCRDLHNEQRPAIHQQG